MTTKATPKLETAKWFGAALLIMAIAGVPAVAAAGISDCSPATCTSPVMGPGHHLETETR